MYGRGALDHEGSDLRSTKSRESQDLGSSSASPLSTLTLVLGNPGHQFEDVRVHLRRTLGTRTMSSQV